MGRLSNIAWDKVIYAIAMTVSGNLVFSLVSGVWEVWAYILGAVFIVAIAVTAVLSGGEITYGLIFVDMAMIYKQVKETEGVSNTDILVFNEKMCRYLRYESIKGAVFFIDLKHLKTMQFADNPLGNAVIQELGKHVTKNTDTVPVFVQNEISPLSFYSFCNG
jgi:hypothetical protein